MGTEFSKKGVGITVYRYAVQMHRLEPCWFWCMNEALIQDTVQYDFAWPQMMIKISHVWTSCHKHCSLACTGRHSAVKATTGISALEAEAAEWDYWSPAAWHGTCNSQREKLGWCTSRGGMCGADRGGEEVLKRKGTSITFVRAGY